MPTMVEVNENLPYFMFSLDLNHKLVNGESPLDVVHVYVGNPAMCFFWNRLCGPGGRTTLENFYFFFDAASQLARGAGRSVPRCFDATRCRQFDAVLLPEWRQCRTICLANKQTHDCIYFSGVTVEQLLWLLHWQQYPAPIASFVKQNRRNLDHLLFDVGFDYGMERDCHSHIIKSGYYGVF